MTDEQVRVLATKIAQETTRMWGSLSEETQNIFVVGWIAFLNVNLPAEERP